MAEAGPSVRARQQAHRLAPLTGEQLAACDPKRHAWLHARPGTGSKLVLAARIWRLLLSGVSPETILCLMRDRTEATLVCEKVMEQLSRWVRASEGELVADMAAIGAANASEDRARARSLLAQVLDCPGGLRIQSFDDFAMQQLSQYPFEAGLAPPVVALAEEQQADLSRTTLADLRALANREGRSDLSRAIDAVFERLGLYGTTRYLQECARHAPAITALPARVETWLHTVVGLAGGADPGVAPFAVLAAQALEAGRDFVRLYAHAKRRQGACDRDDLLTGAVELLEHPAFGELARFHLDQGTHHVLVADAQDTDWRHWRMVGAIADEFFAGQGAHDLPRTLFVCGDPLIATDGNNPIFLEAAFVHFSGLANAARVPGYDDGSANSRPFDRIHLTRQFGSAQPIVEFADVIRRMLLEATTAGPDHAADMTSGTPVPGCVMLMPTDARDEDRQEAGDETGFCARIARLIGRWLESGDILASTGELPRAQDIAILLKRPGRLTSRLVARLQASGIPVAVERGAAEAPDRIVAALLRAARVAVDRYNDDDLVLLLRSPLMDAPNRGADRGAVRTRGSAGSSGALERRAILADIDGLASLARRTSPHAFFEKLLSGDWEGRRRFASAWGEAAIVQAEVLLDAALEFERANVPSLRGFLDWFEENAKGLGLDPATPCPAVRIMHCGNVRNRHFPIVILADASDSRTARQNGFIRYPFDGSGLEVPIIAPGLREASGPLAAQHANAVEFAREEDWRLLYLAVNSASDRLVIAGAHTAGFHERDGADWYEACERALDRLGVARGPDGIRKFEGTGGNPPAAVEPDARRARRGMRCAAGERA